MTYALRWAAMRAILMFHNCEGQSHKTVSTDHSFWRERRAEADSNRGPSAYQPNALPLGQTGSHVHRNSLRFIRDVVGGGGWRWRGRGRGEGEGTYAMLVPSAPIFKRFGKTATTATIDINPFTAPACQISGLKDTSSAMRPDENPFTSQREKGDKRAYSFKFRTFMCCFRMILQWRG